MKRTMLGLVLSIFMALNGVSVAFAREAYVVGDTVEAVVAGSGVTFAVRTFGGTEIDSVVGTDLGPVCVAEFTGLAPGVYYMVGGTTPLFVFKVERRDDHRSTAGDLKRTERMIQLKKSPQSEGGGGTK